MSAYESSPGAIHGRLKLSWKENFCRSRRPHRHRQGARSRFSNRTFARDKLPPLASLRITKLVSECRMNSENPPRSRRYCATAEIAGLESSKNLADLVGL